MSDIKANEPVVTLDNNEPSRRKQIYGAYVERLNELFKENDNSVSKDGDDRKGDQTL